MIPKIRSITKLYSTLLYFYFLYEYSKHFVQPVVQPVVQRGVAYNRLLYNRLQNVNGL